MEAIPHISHPLILTADYTPHCRDDKLLRFRREHTRITMSFYPSHKSVRMSAGNRNDMLEVSSSRRVITVNRELTQCGRV